MNIFKLTAPSHNLPANTPLPLPTPLLAKMVVSQVFLCWIWVARLHWRTLGLQYNLLHTLCLICIVVPGNPVRSMQSQTTPALTQILFPNWPSNCIIIMTIIQCFNIKYDWKNADLFIYLLNYLLSPHAWSLKAKFQQVWLTFNDISWIDMCNPFSFSQRHILTFSQREIVTFCHPIASV